MLPYDLEYDLIKDASHHMMIYAGALIQNDLSAQYGKAVVEYVTEYMSCINKLYDKEDQPFKCTHWNEGDLRLICNNDNIDETYVCDICGAKFSRCSPDVGELEMAVNVSCAYFDKNKKKYDMAYIQSIINNYFKVKLLFSRIIK